MFEVEYKAHAADLEAVRRRLVDASARSLGTRVETDTYYAHPMRDFARTDEALRLRAADGGVRLTYKGVRAPGPTRTREEVEVAVDGDLARVLEALGFRAAGTVVKSRETYRLGDVIVTLDDVQGLGTFVEVEALAADASARDGARQRVLDAVARLGLGPEEPRSYLEMVLAGTGT